VTSFFPRVFFVGINFFYPVHLLFNFNIFLKYYYKFSFEFNFFSIITYQTKKIITTIINCS
jgi:hypothetical protein